MAQSYNSLIAKNTDTQQHGGSITKKVYTFLKFEINIFKDAFNNTQVVSLRLKVSASAAFCMIF